MLSRPFPRPFKIFRGTGSGAGPRLPMISPILLENASKTYAIAHARTVAADLDHDLVILTPYGPITAGRARLFAGAGSKLLELW